MELVIIIVRVVTSLGYNLLINHYGCFPCRANSRGFDLSNFGICVSFLFHRKINVFNADHVLTLFQRQSSVELSFRNHPLKPPHSGKTLIQVFHFPKYVLSQSNCHITQTLLSQTLSAAVLRRPPLFIVETATSEFSKHPWYSLKQAYLWIFIPNW